MQKFQNLLNKSFEREDLEELIEHAQLSSNKSTLKKLVEIMRALDGKIAHHSPGFFNHVFGD